MVHMVRHQAVRPNRDAIDVTGIVHQTDIDAMIGVVTKHVGLTISSLGNVMRTPRHYDSRRSHDQFVQERRTAKGKDRLRSAQSERNENGWFAIQNGERYV
jgi:hypothetical protein